MNLGWFVLDNASNNDTTLRELAKTMGFNVEEKRLRCMGHILISLLNSTSLAKMYLPMKRSIKRQEYLNDDSSGDNKES